MNAALLTDLYELTMIQGYFYENPNQQAVFDMFFRRQPFDGGFSVFAGLEPLVDFLLNLKFSQDDIDYLKSLKLFKPDFLDYLRHFRFEGDIYAMPEGCLVFPNEPIIRVHGKITEVQLIESILLNQINFQTLVATKTARIFLASGKSDILEFGLRRAQGIDGAISATRAAFIGGASSSSNVLTGKKFNIPVKGTMAHSWIMSFPSELEAFTKFADMYPHNCILLVDTYDTLKSGIPNAIKVLKKLKTNGISNFGIRLDSGDLEYLSKQARKIFDNNDLPEVKIFASNELDEWIIHQLMENNAPIDAWGVGTKLVTADQDPSLTGVYKICAKQRDNQLIPCMKITNNPAKMSNPGIKNIYRFYNDDNQMLADLIYLEENDPELHRQISRNAPLNLHHPHIDYAHCTLNNYAYAKKLLQPIIKNGLKLLEHKPLTKIQANTLQQLNSLDETYKRLLNPHIYKVSLSDNLYHLKRQLVEEYTSRIR